MQTGNIIQGSVLDIDKRYFERKLKEYEPRLYLKWNPKKNRGFGVWEIRIRPTKKTAIYQCDYQGSKIFTLEYVESDYTHHILDVPVLNMRVFTRLREMDHWENKTLADDLDYLSEKALIKAELEEDENRRRYIRENKKYFREMYEATRSGINPFSLFFGRYKK